LKNFKREQKNIIKGNLDEKEMVWNFGHYKICVQCIKS
jgi:hypothetical protein